MARKDPEANKAYSKQYKEKNKERLKIASQEYYKANKEKKNAISRAHYHANKERRKADAKAWLKNNPERAKDTRIKWLRQSTEGLSDYYVNLSIRKGTSLKSKDIPKELTEAKRVAILIERQLREMLPKGICRNPDKRREQKRISNAKWREANRELIRERKAVARRKSTTN